MTGSRVRISCGVVGAAFMLAVAGCAGSGQTHYLDVKPKVPPVRFAEAEPVRILIEPFDDRRTEKSRVGMRTHLWGGVTYFNVAGERPGAVVAQALADRLKSRGWRDRPWNVKLAPSKGAGGDDADIIITGEVHDFSANAKSRVFSTPIKASSKLTIQARNVADGSTTTRSIEGAQTQTVFWFNERDVQDLMTATLKDALDRFVMDTTIEQRAVRPVR